MDGDVTALLRAWGSGDESVSDELFQAVYGQLRSLARHHLRSRTGITLTPTVLINDAFLELAGDPKNDWRDRVQFFAFTATVMRRLMSAHARRRNAGKRGANVDLFLFDESTYPVFDRDLDAAKLDDALTALEKLEPIQARVVELRFFGGLTVQEVAEFMGVSERTVIRQWGLAKAWLAGQLGGSRASDPVGRPGLGGRTYWPVPGLSSRTISQGSIDAGRIETPSTDPLVSLFLPQSTCDAV